MKCDTCQKSNRDLFEVFDKTLCLFCRKKEEDIVFKKGTRVFHEKCGYGTVTHEPYFTSDFSTWTCVKYDDFLGQKESLCGDNMELVVSEE